MPLPKSWTTERKRPNRKSNPFAQYQPLIILHPAGGALPLPYRVRFLLSKIYPQGLWNVETFAVEKSGAKFYSTVPVENFCFSTLCLWRKIRCSRNAKGTFPHNFPLRLLLLPKLIYR